MPRVTIEFRNVEGTEAAMGWAGSHTLVERWVLRAALTSVPMVQNC